MSKLTPGAALSKLWDDLSLRPYLGEIRRRHGIVETLALPSMYDLPPLRIETLFVSPLLAEQPVSADSDPMSWPEGKSLLVSLQEYPQLVVLGDPGGGKTTLSNWLAWRLSSGLTTPLPPVLENRVPLPCVLREMPPSVFTSELTLPDLAVIIADRLLGEKADDTLKASLRMRVATGMYVLILDGVDEIPVPHRKIVADWVRQAHLQNACMLATSRMVGYEDWPVHTFMLETSSKWNIRNDLIHKWNIRNDLIHKSTADTFGHNWIKEINLQVTKLSTEKNRSMNFSLLRAQVRYLMPFDQGRIAAFAENWYRQRCGTEHEALQKASDLLASLAQSDVTRQLARTPNLLSLMAIVHRERAHLPDGKALLYDEIANAYINTIDKQRKILSGDVLAPYGWKERKAWLAYVGFQMQQLRGNQQKDNKETDAGVLASEADVLTWLTHAMRVSGVHKPAQAAQTFLSWVARRSGLLLPRGEKRYAFVHLSFQEYFCACYLDARIVSPAFIRNKPKNNEPVTRVKLTRWSKLTVWRETLVYLFELLSAERDADWVDDLAEILFKPTRNDTQLHGAQAELAGRVLADRHIRLPEEWKDGLADRSSSQAEQDWTSLRHKKDMMVVLPALLSTGYAAIVSAPLDEPDKALDLHLPGQKFTNLQEISTESKLRICIVTNEKTADVTPLSELTNLRGLFLLNTQVADITPFTKLKKLQTIVLMNTKVTDVTPLTGLHCLQRLDLDGTPVMDITPLAGFKNLQALFLSRTHVTDAKPLAGLVNLQVLFLGNTKVTDITPLANLRKLRTLFLYDTKVADVAPLAGLNNLQALFLTRTQVADVTPLTGLNNLQELFLSYTQVTDVTQLAQLHNLQELDLSDTKVVDVRPLAKLKNLRSLDLSNTQVVDIMPLSGLNNLQTLNLNNTQLVDVNALVGLKKLRKLSLIGTHVTDVTPLAGLKQLVIERTQTTVEDQVTPRKKRKSAQKLKS
ncbi:MAG: leucine-rich repeat domain-containing protein [Pseudomonadota bacterium]